MAINLDRQIDSEVGVGREVDPTARQSGGLKTAVWAGSEVAGICTVDLANAALSGPATRPTQRQARTLFWASIDLTFAVPSL